VLEFEKTLIFELPGGDSIQDTRKSQVLRVCLHSPEGTETKMKSLRAVVTRIWNKPRGSIQAIQLAFEER